MVMEIRLGDIVRLKKSHPCGGDEWEVVRLGADIRIKCRKCQHLVMLDRGTFERRVKTFISRGKPGPETSLADKKQELEARLADLKGRWPAHSVPPAMWQELEQIETELEHINREIKTRD